MHVLKECKVIEVKMLAEEFLKEDGRGLELIKRTDSIREETRREEKKKEMGLRKRVEKKV